MTERREPSNTAEQQQEKGLLAHQMYWHECVQQLDGENSEPNEHNSMTLQFGTRRSRSQAAVVMCLNCAAEQIQHFSKTIYLETHHEYTHCHVATRKGRSLLQSLIPKHKLGVQDIC